MIVRTETWDVSDDKSDRYFGGDASDALGDHGASRVVHALAKAGAAPGLARETRNAEVHWPGRLGATEDIRVDIAWGSPVL